MKSTQAENPSGGNQTDNKSEIDIENENENVNVNNSDLTVPTGVEDVNMDCDVEVFNSTYSNNCSTDEDYDTDDNLLSKRILDDSARPARRKNDQNVLDNIDEDVMSEDERTEIDGKIVVEVDVPESPESRPSNTYAAKKTVAQGMMDIALLTANANQLRYAMELKNSVVVGLIVFSLVLQVSIGIAMIFKGRMQYRGKSKDPFTIRLDTVLVSGIFLITVINIFIASFTTTNQDTSKTKMDNH